MADKHGGHDDHKKDDIRRAGPKSGDGSGSKEASEKPTDADLKTFWNLPLVKQVRDGLKGFLDIDLSTGLSWFDDNSEEFARKLADGLSKKFPKDSIVRAWVVRKTSSVIINQIEKIGETQGKTVNALIEKFSDFLEHFRSSFFGSKEAADKAEMEAITTERAKRFDAGDAKLADDGLDLILASPPSGLGTIRKVNHDRASAWHDHKETIRNGSPKPEVPKVPLSERLRQVDEEVERVLEPIVAQMEKSLAESKANTARKEAAQKAERKAKPPARRGWILRLLLGSRKTTT